MSVQKNFWQDHDAIQNRKLIPISNMQLRDLGVCTNWFEHVEKMEELRNNPPNIVIGEAKKYFRIRQNFYKDDQELKKGISYVMGLGVYQQIHSDTDKQKILVPSKMKFKNIYRPYMGQDLTNKSLIVMRTGGIGDLLFIQPNLIYLKEKYPTCRIIFSCGKNYQAMVKNWGCVDELIDLPFPVKYLIDTSYHCLFEGVIERCKEAHIQNSYRLFTKWMGLNLPDEKLLPRQVPDQKSLDEIKENLKNINLQENDFLIFQLRSSTPIRTPDLNFWCKMIDNITDRGHKVAIVDRKGMSDRVDDFMKGLKNKDKVYNLAKFLPSLNYTIALTSLCKMVVATDSALNHIAASLDVKCYGIYGPFPGEIRLTTYPKAKWVDAKRHCAPCFLHQPKPCPEAGLSGYSPCYNNIDIQNTCDEIEGFLND